MIRTSSKLHELLRFSLCIWLCACDCILRTNQEVFLQLQAICAIYMCKKSHSQAHWHTTEAVAAEARAIGVARRTTTLPLSDLLLYMAMTLFQKQHTLMFFFFLFYMFTPYARWYHKCYVFWSRRVHVPKIIWSCMQTTPTMNVYTTAYLL